MKRQIAIIISMLCIALPFQVSAAAANNTEASDCSVYVNCNSTSVSDKIEAAIDIAQAITGKSLSSGNDCTNNNAGSIGQVIGDIADKLQNGDCVGALKEVLGQLGCGNSTVPPDNNTPEQPDDGDDDVITPPNWDDILPPNWDDILPPNWDDDVTPPDNGNDTPAPPVDDGNDDVTPPDNGNDTPAPPVDDGNDDVTPPDNGNDTPAPPVDDGNDDVTPPDNGNDPTPEPPVVNPDQGSSSYVAEVIRLVNEQRAAAGLSALTEDTTLDRAASIRASEVSTYFAHTRPNGTNCFTVLDEVGASYGTAGENIAAGQSTPSVVMNDWMNSAGHRANILNSSFNKIGVGIYQDASGRTCWAQIFTS